MTNPYDDAEELAALFRRMEHALKRSNFLRERADAQADWNRFARELGASFYNDMKASGRADVLLGKPPRKLMKEGLKWEPLNPQPLTNVIELFELGVCRVRNSFIHGEKFVGSANSGQWDRDAILVAEALFVLREASTRIPTVFSLLAQREPK